jgi:antitoxin component YwqK of YwqJK toxin-antitoxin module
VDTLRRWYARGGKHLVWGGLVVVLVLAGLWCLIRMVGAVCPTVVELAVPRSLHGVFHSLGLIGQTEKAYYQNGSLCYEKHFLPFGTEWLSGSAYKPYGRWVSVSPDGRTTYHVHFPKPTGKWVEWYPSGSVYRERNWLDGERHGAWRRWNEDGTLESESHYTHDELDGKYRIWFENGVKASERFYVQGRLEGHQTQWYEDGRKRYEREIRNGQVIYRISYARDGRIAAQLRGPNPTGKWIEWYGNGQKHFEGYYLEGKRHGKWTAWYANGTLRHVTWYDQGVYHRTPPPELRAWQSRMESGESSS